MGKVFLSSSQAASFPLIFHLDGLLMVQLEAYISSVLGIFLDSVKWHRKVALWCCLMHVLLMLCLL